MDAVAETGRFGPVREDVAEMAAAGRAQHLGASHPERSGPSLVDRLPAHAGAEKASERQPESYFASATKSSEPQPAHA